MYVRQNVVELQLFVYLMNHRCFFLRKHPILEVCCKQVFSNLRHLFVHRTPTQGIQVCKRNDCNSTEYSRLSSPQLIHTLSSYCAYCNLPFFIVELLLYGSCCTKICYYSLLVDMPVLMFIILEREELQATRKCEY